MRRDKRLRPRLRKLWLGTHRWLGLTVGLLFVLLGLTGSALVFDHAIDEWLNPELLLSESSAVPRPLSELLAAAEEATPEPVAAMSRPRIPEGVWTAWVQTGTEELPEWTQVYVDPATATVTGTRVWGTDLMGTIYRLHYTLLGGDVGAVVVGLAGIVLMVSVISGLYLWWPLLRNGWRAALVIRRDARFTYDLHKTVGAVSSLLLLVIAFTGVYMTFPEWIKPAVRVLSEETPHPRDLKAHQATDGAPLLPEEALAIAQQRFPEAKFDHFHPPGDDGVYEMAFRQSGEIQRSYGRSQVFVDPHTGEIVAERDTHNATAADSFIAAQFPLHNGEAFGLVGRWIVFFSGLTPAVLYVTGCMLWWRRRASRRRQQSRKVDVQIRRPAPMPTSESLVANISN